MLITRCNDMTNSMMIGRHIFAFALAVVVRVPTLATARTHLGRHIIGIVQNTNVQMHEAEILQTDTGVPLGFIWNNRTTFVANMQVADAAILKRGAKIEVSYHQPLFGRPYVTKVTLLSNSPFSAKSRPPQIIRQIHFHLSAAEPCRSHGGQCQADDVIQTPFKTSHEN